MDENNSQEEEEEEKEEEEGDSDAEDEPKYSNSDQELNQIRAKQQKSKKCSKTEDEIKTRKKFNRVNKVFYNGFLNKPENRHSSLPEYQAHAAELLHFLKSLWVTNSMCDLSFVIGNRKYPAHRLSLAMFSRKYRDEFQKQLHSLSSKDCAGGIFTINLKSTSNGALEAILKYIYTAKIDINPANAEEILLAAKELDVHDLVCMANEYLSSLSIGDLLEFMGNILNKEGSELVFYELYSYMMNHLDKISRTPEYLKASVTVVRAILTDSHLSVRTELEVYEAAMRWIDFDRVNRFKHLCEVLTTVRFTLLSPDEIVIKIETQSELMNNSEILGMIYNAFKYHALSGNVTGKLSTLIKREESRNLCMKGASVPDEFVKVIVELSDIARKIKAARVNTTNKILD